MIKFNIDGMVIPSFPFPAPVMVYILQNLQPQHLIKLYQCSKLFYFKYGQNIIQHLEIVDDGEPESFGLAKTIVCTSNPVLKELADFWLSGSLIHRAQTETFPAFTHCTIKKLEVCGDISWKDFELLTNAGNIEDMKIAGVFRGNEYASVDEIFAKVPNATSIQISKSEFTPTSCATLLSLDHKVKMSNLVLKNILDGQHDYLDLFIGFVLKISAEQCNVFIDFKMVPEVDDESREMNPVLVELGNNYRRLIANELKLKKLKEQIDA